MTGYRVLNGKNSKDPLDNNVLHEQMPFNT